MKIELVDMKDKYNVYIDNRELAYLECTCDGCPEQYEMFSYLTGQQLAYFRLRNGYYRVDVPDCGGETVYDFDFPNDPWMGNFRNETQRQSLLKEAIVKIIEYYREKNKDEE